MEGTRHALIVEDRQDWQTILSRVMESIMWHVDLAANYDEALSLLANNVYDLAIIDPMLDTSDQHNRDGLRLLEEIHNHYPETPLIVVSGSLSPQAIAEATQLPPDVPLVEKQKWDREAFKGLVLQRTIAPEDSIGRRTAVRLLRKAVQYRPSISDIPLPPAENSRKGTPRILIVEDRPDWQVILSRILDEEDWFWRSVPNASDALTLIADQKQQFNIVLLDLRFAEAGIPSSSDDSWALLEYLANTENHQTRVIVVSGEASRGEIATLDNKYPIEGFVDKDTFKKNELLELIYNLSAKTTLHIKSLGNFQVWRDKEAIDDFGSDAAETLFKILLTQRKTAIPSEEVMDALTTYDNEQGKDIQPNLHAIVNDTRFVLEPELVDPDGSEFILQVDGQYVLAGVEHVKIDFEEMEQYLAAGKAHQAADETDHAIDCYEAASSLYQGEYLPNDRFADWSILLRAKLQKQVVRILHPLADLYATQGDFTKAIEATQTCLQHDAYNEATHRRLMRYHRHKGNKKAALTVYSTWEKLKREFFGEAPAPQTEALRDAIANDAELPPTEPTR